MRRVVPWILLVIGSFSLVVGGLAAYANRNIINSATFAEHVNQMRHDPRVEAPAGDAITSAIIDADPDLLAIKPALSIGAAALVGSDAFDAPFTKAVTTVQEALTSDNPTSGILMVANLGSTAVTALERFVPAAKGKIPNDLNVTLAEFGTQRGIAATIIPIVRWVKILSWVMPAVALLCFLLAVLLGLDRRRTLLQVGWATLVAAGFLGLVVIAGAVYAGAVDDTELVGALIASAWDAFGDGLVTVTMLLAIIGALLVAAANAMLPDVDLDAYIRKTMSFWANRPERPLLAILRGLALGVAGLFILFQPTLSAQIAMVVAGLWLFFYGLGEIDVVARKDRAEDEARAAELGEAIDSSRPFKLLVPIAAAVAAFALVGYLVLSHVLPQDASASPADGSSNGSTTACNGHDELCDRTFDMVAFPAAHNVMSAADEPSWFLAEQPTGVVGALKAGIRVLLIDTWYGQETQGGGAITPPAELDKAQAEFEKDLGKDVSESMRRLIDSVRKKPVIGPREPHMCHTICEIGATKLLPVLKNVKAWMDANPREVVTFFIQDEVTPADTAKVFADAGLADMAYTHPAGAPWPTLGEMISSGKRLLVLMESTSGGTEFPWLHQGFDLVQDTDYTFPKPEDFTCTLKRGKPDSPIFAINHWLSGFDHLVSNAEKVNAYDVLWERVSRCQEERGRLPNFVAVNFFDRGDLFRVVDQLNGFVTTS